MVMVSMERKLDKQSIDLYSEADFVDDMYNDIYCKHEEAEEADDESWYADEETEITGAINEDIESETAYDENSYMGIFAISGHHDDEAEASIEDDDEDSEDSDGAENTDSDNHDDNEQLPHMTIKHESLRISLIRQERAARTQEDFEKLSITWDRLDGNRERRERRKEIGFEDDSLEWAWIDQPRTETIIPAPLQHTWWRELLKGEFINIIHDCPHDIQEFTASRNVYELIDALKDTQKEVLYYRAIRYWSNQKIAAMRGQTDRNILKTYTTLIESLRYNLYMRLLPRFRVDAPLTVAQRRFVESLWGKYGNGKSKRKRRTKAEMAKAAEATSGNNPGKDSGSPSYKIGEKSENLPIIKLSKEESMKSDSKKSTIDGSESK